MICPSSTPGGSKCCLQYGHDGSHRAWHGFKWSDEQAAAWKAAMLKEMR